MSNRFSRRKYLKASAAAVSALGLPAFWLPESAQAAGSGPKKLVLFFLNGGNDSLNMLVPTTSYHTTANGGAEIPDTVTNHPLSQYRYYQQLRPRIHLKKTGDGAGPHLLPLGQISGRPGAHRLAVSDAPEAAVTSPTYGVKPIGSVEFSLHPEMASLLPIWNAGHMAVFPAAHCGPGADRSHFFQTEYFGHGLNTTHSEQHGDGKGWVGRYFESKYGTPNVDGIEGFDFESGYHPVMDGNIPVLGMSDPERVNLGLDGRSIRDNTLAINTLRAGSTSTAYANYAQIQQDLFARVAKLQTVDYSSPIVFPDSSLGRGFRRAAGLIKDPTIGLEIEVINLDRGDFDTHDNQVSNDGNGNLTNSAEGSHAITLKDCADCIKAFYDDIKLAGCGDDVVVVVQTEFGRTAEENESFGTDHARAATWLVIGGENMTGTNKNIHGGLYGAWPGIAHNVEDPPGSGNFHRDLDGTYRSYLHQTTDYRDILAEIIGEFLSNNVDPSAPFNPSGSTDYSRIPQNFVDNT